MNTRGQQDMLVARTFPTSDLIFAERVRELLQRRSDADAPDVCEALETSLRGVYPAVRVTTRDSGAGFGDTVIYVFRDGSATSAMEAVEWISDPATARLVTDRSGTYIDANERAEHLFGRTAAEIIGSKAG